MRGQAWTHFRSLHMSVSSFGAISAWLKAKPTTIHAHTWFLCLFSVQTPSFFFVPKLHTSDNYVAPPPPPPFHPLPSSLPHLSIIYTKTIVLSKNCWLFLFWLFACLLYTFFLSRWSSPLLSLLIIVQWDASSILGHPLTEPHLCMCVCVCVYECVCKCVS